jgi:DNA mismatch repair ATPase MutS
MNTPAIILISLVLLFFIISPLVDIRKAKKKLRERLTQSWAKQPETKYKHEDLESIASYFLNRKRQNTLGFIIDDITWHDLDMDDVFIRLNSTETSVGEETLYRLLREPSFDVDILKARQRLIEFLRINEPVRTEIQVILAKLGKKRLVNASDYFFKSISPMPWDETVYRLLSVIALLSPLLLLVHPGLGVLLILLSFSTNMFVYYRKKFSINADLDALIYIVRLTRCAGRLIDAESKDPDLGELKRTLQSQYEGIKGIGKRGFYLSFSGTGSLMDMVGEYIKIILLKELIDYEFLRKAVAEHRGELTKVYDAIGLLDSLISIASFRESVPFYCEPNLKSHKPGTIGHLHFEGIYHPMIPDPVLNSLAIDRPVLVTGSNASGKSTFLKTIAVNAILAQSFHTCLARKYSSSIVAVFTSMALRDSMRDGESYFVAEIKSIKRILDYRPDSASCLCLIDEVLRGTNTVERIAASSQVLLQLVRQYCLCIAATHDIELTYILEDSYQNVHFQESITGDGIAFDYKLYDGRATSRNAIKLLQLMGYGKSIVEQAEKRANRFASQGTWEKEL